MAYCTQANIEADIGIPKLVELTDGTKSTPPVTGDVTAATVTHFIEKAQKKIDTHLYVSYPSRVPIADGDDVPSCVKHWAIDLVIYFLYGRRPNIPEGVETRYKETMFDLTDIQKGKGKVPDWTSENGKYAISTAYNDGVDSWKPEHRLGHYDDDGDLSTDDLYDDPNMEDV